MVCLLVPLAKPIIAWICLAMMLVKSSKNILPNGFVQNW